MLTQAQTSVIRKMKGGEPARAAAEGIAINNDAGALLGWLVPLNPALADDEEIVGFITAWRRRFMRFFMTQFTATRDRTRSWLRDVVLKDDTRILFLIRDDTGKWIGNFGTCNITSHSAELDNLIRGEKGGDRRLVFHSELALMRWLYQVLDVEAIYLHVFSHNDRTLRLHRSVGFVERRLLPLGKEETEGLIRYFVEPGENDQQADFQLVEMAIQRRDFFARYPWLNG